MYLSFGSPNYHHLSLSDLRLFKDYFNPPIFLSSILQAAAQPHGRIFQVAELYGNVNSGHRNQEPPRSSSVPNVPFERVSKETEQRPRETRSSGTNILECNRKYLCWGGVDIGNNV